MVRFLPVLKIVKIILSSILPFSFYQCLRSIWQKWRKNRFQSRVVWHQYGLYPLRVLITEPVAEKWYDRPWIYPQEFGVLKRFGLSVGARVFDLGGHQGVVALMLAHKVGQEGTIIAVEANPENVQVARRNQKINKVLNLQIVHAAVSDRYENLSINGDSNGQIDLEKK